MDNETRIIVFNMGSMYLVFIGNVLYLLVFAFLWLFEVRFDCIRKIRHKMQKQMFWNALLVLGLESYLDVFLAVVVSF